MDAGIFVIALLTALDQYTKYLGRVDPEWVGAFWFLEKTFFLNGGIAFSIPVSGALYWGLLVVVVIALVVAFVRRRPLSSSLLGGSKWGVRRVALGLIILGGLSNIIDRLRFGGVIDVFALPWGLTFNIADIMIVVGLLLSLRRLRFNFFRHDTLEE